MWEGPFGVMRTLLFGVSIRTSDFGKTQILAVADLTAHQNRGAWRMVLPNVQKPPPGVTASGTF